MKFQRSIVRLRLDQMVEPNTLNATNVDYNHQEPREHDDFVFRFYSLFCYAPWASQHFWVSFLAC